MKRVAAPITPDPPSLKDRIASVKSNSGIPRSSKESRKSASVDVAEKAVSSKPWLTKTIDGRLTVENAIKSKDLCKKQEKNLLSAMENGVPFAFAFDSALSRFSIFCGDLDVKGTRLNSQDGSKSLIYAAFLEADSPAVLLTGNWNVRNDKRDDVMVRLFLQPQELCDRAQFRSRVLYDTLLDVSGLDGQYLSYRKKVAESMSRSEKKLAKANLVIDACASSNQSVLSLLLEQGFSANSHDPFSGVWAVNVARLHHREGALRMLKDWGADMDAKETSPI